MSADSKHRFDEANAAQQRFPSLFLRSEGEIFRYVAALAPKVTDAEDLVQQTALALWEKFDACEPAQPFTPWACRFAGNGAEGHWREKQALKLGPPFRIGAAGLGNWKAKSGPHPAPTLIRNLSGAMDEFELFSRALSDAEVRELYANGKPDL
jgi:DNA-directed RNA polymerase specialized sigma24 family protein